jgi:hypothetical protein
MHGAVEQRPPHTRLSLLVYVAVAHQRNITPVIE